MDEIEPSAKSVPDKPEGKQEETKADQKSPSIANLPDEKKLVVPPSANVQATDKNQPKAHHKERTEDLKPKREPMKLDAKLMVILTTVIAIATAVNVWVFYYESEDTSTKMKTLADKAGQIVGTMNTALSDNRDAISKAFDANREALKASEKQSISASRMDQRAWVGIKNFDVLGKTVSAGQMLRVNMNVVNTGKTPALDVGMIDCGSGDTQAFAEASHIGCAASLGDRSVIAPTGEWIFLSTAGPASQIYAERMNAGAQRTYIRGTIQYRDIFKSTHQTRFCAYFFEGSDAGFAFLSCPTGNSMN